MKKDGLTDLVQEVSSDTSGSENNGSINTPSGETVTLGFKIDQLARKLLSYVKKQRENRKK